MDSWAALAVADGDLDDDIFGDSDTAEVAAAEGQPSHGEVHLQPQWEALVVEDGAPPDAQWESLALDDAAEELLVEPSLAAGELLLEPSADLGARPGRRGRVPKHHAFIDVALQQLRVDGQLVAAPLGGQIPGDGQLAAATAAPLVGPSHAEPFAPWSALLPARLLAATISQRFVPFSPSCLAWPARCWLHDAALEEASGKMGEQKTRALSKHLYDSIGAIDSTSSRLSATTGLKSSDLARKEVRLYASFLLAAQAEHAAVHKALAQLADPDVKLEYVVEASRQDETPMRARSRDKSDITPLCQGSTDRSSSSVQALPLGSGSAAMAACAKRVQQTAGTQKIVQTETSYAFLLSFSSETGSRNYTCLLASAPRRLFVVDRTTGETIRETLRRSSMLSAAIRACKDVDRVSCTDRAGQNDRAELGFHLDRRGCNFRRLGTFHCEVHMAATIHAHTFADMSEAITGIIRIGLSLQMGSYMGKFRKILREIIWAETKIMVGEPPSHATRYRLNCLQLFGGIGAGAVERLVAMGLLPNGDWRHGQVELWVPPDVRNQFSDNQLKARLSYGIEYAVASKAPPLYKRHRWLGMELTLNPIGLLTLCHNLFPRCYRRFVASFSKSTTTPQACTSDEALGVEAAICDGAALAPLVQGAEAVPNDSTSAWKRENMEHRSLGLKFVDTHPVEDLVVMRLVLEPMRQMLSAKLYASGDRSEVEQRTLELMGSLCGDGEVPPRSFRVLISALSVHELAAQRKLKMLFDDAIMWSLLHQTCFTEACNVKIFRMLSRQGALIEELLIHRQSRCPYFLFTALLGPEQAARVMSQTRCCRDPFVDQFLRCHDITTEAGRLRLLAMAQVIFTDIARIECLHGDLRRILVKMGVQTHSPDLSLACGRWMASQWRKQMNRLDSFQWPSCVGNVDSEEHRQPQQPHQPAKKARTGGGGAWRAFVSEQTRGCHGLPELGEVAAAYRGLAADVRDRLAARGAVGTRAHQANPEQSAFGPSAHQVEAHKTKRANDAICARLAAIPMAPARNYELAKIVLANARGSVDIFGCVREARSRSRYVSANLLAKSRKQIKDLQEFAAKSCTELSSKLSSALGVAVGWHMPWFAVPCRSLPMFELRSRCASIATSLLAWAEQPRTSSDQLRKVTHQVGATLEADWQAKADTILHAECDAIDDGQLSKPSACALAGRCICQGPGKEVAAFRTSILKALAHLSPPEHSTIRAKLKAGDFVMLMVGAAPENITAEAHHDCLLGAEEVNHFAHIAHMSMSPWRPTLQCMDFKKYNPEDNSIDLQATSTWRTLWDFTEGLDRNLVWCIQLREVLQRRVAVVSMGPNKVKVTNIHGKLGELVPVWTPTHDKVVPRAALLALVEVVEAVPVPEGPANGSDDDGESDLTGGDSSCEEDDSSDGENDGDDNHGDDDLHRAADDQHVTEGPAQVDPKPEARPSRRSRALIDVAIGHHGRIAYYEYSDSRKFFQATCIHKGHASCTKTRTAMGNPRKLAQGRPLGYLVAWMLCSDDHGDKHSHAQIDVACPNLAPSQDDRLAARAIAHIDCADFALLESNERELYQDEGEEPEQCP